MKSTLTSSLGYAVLEKFSLKTHKEKSNKTFLLMAGKEAHTHYGGQHPLCRLIEVTLSAFPGEKTPPDPRLSQLKQATWATMGLESGGQLWKSIHIMTQSWKASINCHHAYFGEAILVFC